MSVRVKSGAGEVPVARAGNPITATVMIATAHGKIRPRTPPARFTSVPYSPGGIYRIRPPSIRMESQKAFYPVCLLDSPMGSRGLLVVILMLVAVTALPPATRGVTPTISNVTWTPWVPAHGEDVVVEADIVSPGGTPSVTASWCVLPPFTCIPFTMIDAGGGHYTSPPIRAAGLPSIGAHFNVSAVDPGGNLSFTQEILVSFATTISVSAGLAPLTPTPGVVVNVSGTASYNNGSGLPAKFSIVDLRILGTPSAWSTTTDGTGAFTSSFVAPTAVESYTLNITASNRTISGSREQPFNVARGPTPDLAIMLNSVGVYPNPAVAGQEVRLSFSIENRGTANAGAFMVRVNVSGPTGVAHTLSFSVAGLPQGLHTNLSDTWVA